MQVSKFKETIKNDPPFSYHRPNPFNKSVLIGGQAEELTTLFEEIYNLSLVNPLMTAIVGNPGTGKTQFLWNLEYRTNQHERDGVVLIYDLKDKPPSYSGIMKFIYSHENFIKSAAEHRIEINDTNDIDEITFKINNVIEKINNDNNNENFGICIGVDGVDEFSRKMVHTKKWSNEEAIIDLLGTFRLVLDGCSKVCIIFALTKDVQVDLIPIISGDQTLRRRFLIANGVNGENVEFGQFKENEAYILVSTFMKNWALRNNFDYDDIAAGNETWPFDKNAIKLAWRMGSAPGTISFTCMDALFEKCNNEITSINDFKISELDVAKSLKKNKSSYSYYLDDEKTWNDINFLINKDAIIEKIFILEVQAKNEIDSQFETALKDAFEKYVSDLGFSVKFGQADLIVGTDFENFTRYISINFIDGITIYNKDAQNLANDISSLNSNAGLFICIIDQNINDNKTYNKVKYQDRFEFLFKNLESRIDYNSTLLTKIMNKKDLWKIIGLQKLEESERKQFVKFLDKKLKIKKILDSLMFSEPSKIP